VIPYFKDEELDCKFSNLSFPSRYSKNLPFSNGGNISYNNKRHCLIPLTYSEDTGTFNLKGLRKGTNSNKQLF